MEFAKSYYKYRCTYRELVLMYNVYHHYTMYRVFVIVYCIFEENGWCPKFRLKGCCFPSFLNFDLRNRGDSHLLKKVEIIYIIT